MLTAEETKKLLVCYFVLVNARHEAKVKMKTIKQTIRAAHGQDIDMGYLAHLYRIDTNVKQAD